MMMVSKQLLGTARSCLRSVTAPCRPQAPLWDGPARCLASQHPSPPLEEARQKVAQLKQEPSNDARLKLYALYKQATTGKASPSSKPGPGDFVAQAKWEAWSKVGVLSEGEALQQYVKLVEELLAKEVTGSSNAAVTVGNYEFLKVVREGGLTTITLNRPEKKNAWNFKMVYEWIEAMEEAAQNKATRITAMTGAGDFFSAGNDFSNLTAIIEDKTGQEKKRHADLLYKISNILIDFPKVLVAVVNGPAIGLGATWLGHCDTVYASDKAWFQTPFSGLGITPEMGSSFTYPEMMGLHLASEMLLFDKKLTAQEASRCGLVTEVFPDDRLMAEVMPRLRKLATLPPQALLYSKGLIKDCFREKIRKASLAESERWMELITSEDAIASYKKFYSGRVSK